MATMTLTGKSGRTYDFHLYSVNAALLSSPACYAYTKA